MANLVLKGCCACAKRQNVREEVLTCYHCGNTLEVVSEILVKPPKVKKRHFRRQQERAFMLEMR